MKKLLVAFMAFAMVFGLGFSQTASAQEGLGDCELCSKCSPYKLPCVNEDYRADYYNVDLDGDNLPVYWREDQPADYGAEDSYEESDTVSNCPVIFNLSECNVDKLNNVGIRMTILVNGQEGDNGVYFAQGYSGRFVMSNNKEFLCDPDCGNTSPQPVYDNDQNLLGYVCGDANATAWKEASFSKFNYYWYTNGNYEEVQIGGSPADVKVVRIESTIDGTYTITDWDYNNDLAYWALDIPAIIVTPDVPDNATISIKISLLSVDDIGEVSEICECTYGLYTYCPNYCIYFPYVAFVAYETEGWDTGIVVSNTEAFFSTPEDMSIKFTFVDLDGNKGEWEVPAEEINAGQNVYLFSAHILRNIYPELPNVVLGQLAVETNFKASGIVFIFTGTLNLGLGHEALNCY